MKMNTANINIRVDRELKAQAEALFSDLGMNMSTAITIFLKSAISHDGLPFEVRRAVPNAETRSALSEYSEMKKNPDAYKRYDSFDDALNEIIADA